ncbi:MAG: hypothetical protein IPJ88_05110 [Myxococcales bacterium]|nr:MAG: hypothetical protein IPJ88_05110 [Myxococcales bacterium]
MKRQIIWLAAFALSLSSCSNKQTNEGDTEALERKEQGKVLEEEKISSLYGSNGELLESDKIVAGLRLPTTLKLVRDEERRHIYESPAPLTALHEYFGKRLLTGVVERRGQSVTFEAAVPKGIRGGVVKLDVWIQPINQSRNRIEIVERRPMPEKPMSDNQVRTLLKKEQEYIQ